MHSWEGIVYKDDRLFILDLTLAKKNDKSVWAVVTRRNCEGFPTFRIDDFKTREEAIDYIQKIEPTTPLISLGGKSPKSPIPYEDYCDKLEEIGIPSAMEIYELNKNVKREIIIEEVREEKMVCVLAITGPLKGHKYFAKSDCPIIIGRGNEAAIKIDFDNYCSRRHAIIYWEGNQCFIEDLNSTNGTFVNNEHIHGKKELFNKDLIGLGNTELVALIGDYQKNEMEEELSKKYAPGRAKMEGKIGVGDFIGDDFDIYQVIEGGMGIVYICYNNKNKKMYALKTIKKYDIFNNETIQKENMPSKEMFKQEAYNWINLGEHPYIVRAYRVQRFSAEMSYPSKLYIIMEYVPPDITGRNTLAHYIGEITYAEVLKIAIQFCYGMEYAYSKGIEAHRDIKPNNIMIVSDLTVKITDFGIAKSSQTIDSKDEEVPEGNIDELHVFKSSSGIVCGTLPYMAPEQFNGYTDKRSDVYSFGIVLYQLVTGGRLPFVGKTPQEYENMHKHQNAASVKSPLFTIIKKCLEKKPEKRYNDFSIIMEELQELFFEETQRKLMPPQIKELGYLEWVNKGYSLFALHKYEEAIDCYNEALEINPKDAHSWYWKGFAFTCIDRHEEALVCYDKAIEIDPKKTDALNNKGAILRDLGRYKEALQCFDKVLKIDYGDDFAVSNKINVLHQLGRFQDAINWYDEVLSNHPDFTDIWWHKGKDLASMNKYVEAIDCYEKALELKPQYIELWEDKAIAYHKLGKNEDAIICCDKAIECDIGNHAYMNKGMILNNIGKYSDAIVCFDKALEMNTEYEDAWYNKAFSLYMLHKYKDATNCVERVLNLDPNHSEGQRLRQLIVEKMDIR